MKDDQFVIRTQKQYDLSGAIRGPDQRDWIADILKQLSTARLRAKLIDPNISPYFGGDIRVGKWSYDLTEPFRDRVQAASLGDLGALYHFLSHQQAAWKWLPGTEAEVLHQMMNALRHYVGVMMDIQTIDKGDVSRAAIMLELSMKSVLNLKEEDCE